MNWIISHPWVWALVAGPVLGAIPVAVAGLEKRALAKLLSLGDAADQKAIKATVKAWVVWAEEKHVLPGMGEVKFAKADCLVEHAMPWMSSDQRKTLIESVLKEIDETANKAVSDQGGQSVPLDPQPGKPAP